jgi:hypothetical protein
VAAKGADVLIYNADSRTLQVANLANRLQGRSVGFDARLRPWYLQIAAGNGSGRWSEVYTYSNGR